MKNVKHEKNFTPIVAYINHEHKFQRLGEYRRNPWR